MEAAAQPSEGQEEEGAQEEGEEEEAAQAGRQEKTQVPEAQ